MVGVSGKVGSETPIKCEFGCLQGALVEKMAVQKFLKRNEEGDWKPHSSLLFSNNEEVPWYLDDGTGRVNVVGALHASGFEFPAYNEVFEQSSRFRESERNMLTDHERGLKFLGVNRNEWVLPIGTSLTVVGQVVIGSNGTIQIQKPKKGPFYVCRKSIDDLIVNHRHLARVLNYTSIALSVIGIIMIAVDFENLQKEQRRSEFQTRLRWGDAQALNRSRTDSAAANTPGENNEGSKESAVNASDGTNSCVVCLEQDCIVVFVPCGHMCCCGTCSSNLRKCPLCRQRIWLPLRTFRS